ncbi:unnamed protein product [Timema podura]|uniref:Uncharacterized protein n=1 Tax=Timema podura TaxID=61482 RepID=A0ABN7P0N6_TIMPD|nr:unnamed protein product [Timema podura]
MSDRSTDDREISDRIPGGQLGQEAGCRALALRGVRHQEGRNTRDGKSCKEDEPEASLLFIRGRICWKRKFGVGDGCELRYELALLYRNAIVKWA